MNLDTVFILLKQQHDWTDIEGVFETESRALAKIFSFESATSKLQMNYDSGNWERFEDYGNGFGDSAYCTYIIKEIKVL